MEHLDSAMNSSIQEMSNTQNSATHSLLISLLWNERTKIGLITLGITIMSILYAMVQPKTWQGEFEIVLQDKTMSGSSEILGPGKGSESLLTAYKNLSGGNDDIMTQVKILQSPAVLRAVYNYRRRYVKDGRAMDNTTYRDWAKRVKTDLIKNTSILRVTYRSKEKKEILPVIKKISEEYQYYSGKNRRESTSATIDYLEASVAKLRPQAANAVRIAQEYALNNGLSMADGFIFTGNSSMSGDNQRTLASRMEEARAKIDLIQRQIKKAREAGSGVVFQAPQNQANSNLYIQYQNIEARLTDLKSRLKDNDELVVNLKQQRKNIISVINAQTIGLLQGELISAKASYEANRRPNRVTIKFSELTTTAYNTNMLLGQLENSLRIANIEAAREPKPWELISEPTISDDAAGVGRSTIVVWGMIGGLAIAVLVVVYLNRIKGIINSEEELVATVPMKIIGYVRSSNLEHDVMLFANGLQKNGKAVYLLDLISESELIDRTSRISILLESLTDRIIVGKDVERAGKFENIIIILTLGKISRRQVIDIDRQVALMGCELKGYIIVI
jgi:succinoglycan biosynthesis transport protein ExoP